MIKIHLVDSVAPRALAMGRAFSVDPRTYVEVDMSPNGVERFGDWPLETEPVEVLKVAHNGDDNVADVLFTSDFRPEDVVGAQAWIWRSVSERDETTWLKEGEAKQLVDWMLSGMSDDEEARPPSLKRSSGGPILVALALLSQVAIDQSGQRTEVLSRAWWRSLLWPSVTQGVASSEHLVELMKSSLLVGRRSSGQESLAEDWLIVEAFVESLVEEEHSLDVDYIVRFLESLRRVLYA